MLEPTDIERLREIFVTRRDCENSVDHTRQEMAELRQDTAVIKTRLNMLIAILGAIGVSVLGIAVKMIIGG